MSTLFCFILGDHYLYSVFVSVNDFYYCFKEKFSTGEKRNHKTLIEKTEIIKKIVNKEKLSHLAAFFRATWTKIYGVM